MAANWKLGRAVSVHPCVKRPLEVMMDWLHQQLWGWPAHTTNESSIATATLPLSMEFEGTLVRIHA